jgi:transcriptional antiterminator RfaH
MWLIAKTKPNQERRAEINLNNQGFIAYLPIIKKKQFRKKSWVSTQELLFSGYIFINSNEFDEKLSKINNTYGISKLLVEFLSLSPYIVPNNVISQIKIRTNNTHNDLINVKKYDKIEITSGLHNSLSGIFLEKCSNNRSKILINILNCQREMIVNNANLQPTF